MPPKRPILRDEEGSAYAFKVASQAPTGSPPRRLISLQAVLRPVEGSPRASPADVEKASRLLSTILAKYRKHRGDSLSSVSVDAIPPFPNLRCADLLQHTHQQAPTEIGRGEILRAILFMLLLDSPTTPPDEDPMPSLADIVQRVHRTIDGKREGEGMWVHLFENVESTARHMIESFFAPLLAEGGMTRIHSVVSPTSHTEAEHQMVAERLKELRETVKGREDDRCAVTRFIDAEVWRKLGQLEREAEEDPIACESAHIIAHSLNQAKKGREDLPEEKKYVWRLLNMFDPGLSFYLQACDIDEPRNAIFLTTDLHREFGKFKVYFEPVDGEPNTYYFRKAPSTALARRLYGDILAPGFKISFTNRSNTHCDLPDPRLLQIHSAIARILHLSAAGSVLDTVFYDGNEVAGQRYLDPDGTSKIYSYFLTRGLPFLQFDTHRQMLRILSPCSEDVASGYVLHNVEPDQEPEDAPLPQSAEFFPLWDVGALVPEV